MRGFDVFRYSGAEIWQDCFGVAHEVAIFLKGSVERQRHGAGKKAASTDGNGGGPLARAATSG